MEVLEYNRKVEVELGTYSGFELQYFRQALTLTVYREKKFAPNISV